MLPGYYIHSANGQTSLVELCDRDGNVIAEIMPKGSATHRAAVVDMLKAMIALSEAGSEKSPLELEVSQRLRCRHSHTDDILAPYGYRTQV